MELKQYQKEAVEELVKKTKKYLGNRIYKKIYLKAPTGAGKTVIASAALEEITRSLPFDYNSLVNKVAGNLSRGAFFCLYNPKAGSIFPYAHSVLTITFALRIGTPAEGSPEGMSRGSRRSVESLTDVLKKRRERP